MSRCSRSTRRRRRRRIVATRFARSSPAGYIVVPTVVRTRLATPVVGGRVREERRAADSPRAPTSANRLCLAHADPAPKGEEDRRVFLTRR